MIQFAEMLPFFYDFLHLNIHEWKKVMVQRFVSISSRDNKAKFFTKLYNCIVLAMQEWPQLLEDAYQSCPNAVPAQCQNVLVFISFGQIFSNNRPKKFLPSFPPAFLPSQFLSWFVSNHQFAIIYFLTNTCPFNDGLVPWSFKFLKHAMSCLSIGINTSIPEPI